MAIYLIVHPKSNDAQKSKFWNQWIDNNRLVSIETTKKVISTCQARLRSDSQQWIYIYRTTEDKLVGPKICSRCRINLIDEEKMIVYFKDQEALNLDPPFQATRGISIHEAEAPAQLKLVS